MIVVIADNPSMGATYRMPEALAPLARDGQVKTIVKQLDGWREWGANHVLEPRFATHPDDSELTASITDAACKLIEDADWLLVMGTTGFDTLGDVTGCIVPRAPIVLYHPESFYRGELAENFNRFVEPGLHCGGLVAATFAMPDLWAGGQCPPGTVPLLQPMIVPPAPPEKTPHISIVHSPGTAKKAIAKGSLTILEGVAAANLKTFTDYRCILEASHEETLAQKRVAHICIDQVPPDGYPAGLGNSGCEGLALACHTISRYEVDTSAYFPNPPIAVAHNADHVASQILAYAKARPKAQESMRRQAWTWARKNLAFDPWRAYLWKHLPDSIRERCTPPPVA